MGRHCAIQTQPGGPPHRSSPLHASSRFPLHRRDLRHSIRTAKVAAMVETIALEINLLAFVRREAAERCVAACPQIGVVSQGRTVREAKACLQEAVELWFESCIERGVLDRALREANFHPSSAADHIRGNSRNSRHRRSVNVLGAAFTIHLRIPGYRAAPLLSASA